MRVVTRKISFDKKAERREGLFKQSKVVMIQLLREAHAEVTS